MVAVVGRVLWWGRVSRLYATKGAPWREKEMAVVKEGMLWGKGVPRCGRWLVRSWECAKGLVRY